MALPKMERLLPMNIRICTLSMAALFVAVACGGSATPEPNEPEAAMQEERAEEAAESAEQSTDVAEEAADQAEENAEEAAESAEDAQEAAEESAQ